MQTFQILHISDIHVKGTKDFDRSVVLDPFLKRIEKDLSKGFNPEIVIVTGDIAYSGLKTEYEPAKGFFDGLLDALRLRPERLFIVLGNPYDVSGTHMNTFDCRLKQQS